MDIQVNFCPAAKPLLPVTSPLYLRRLVRELNATPDGFYYNGYRYGRARLSRENRIYIKAAGFTPELIVLAPHEAFIDAYGRTIHASRKA